MSAQTQLQLPAATGGLIPVAAYVRTSTEHQQYSTENQLDRIKEYAARRGMEIVRVFADEGKSGLSAKHRDGLRRMIAEVESGKANFRNILAYDLSRAFPLGSQTHGRVSVACRQLSPPTERSSV